MPSPGGWDLRRAHALTALFPALAFLVVHVVQVRDAEAGRRAYVDRVLGLDGSIPWTVVELLCFVLPLLAHAVLGVLLARSVDGSPDDATPFRSTTERRWQRVTGIAALAFLLLHLGHTWALRLLGAPGGAVFDHLAATLGRPVFVAVYALGLGAIATHVAVGLPVAAHRLGIGTGARARRAIRVSGLMLGAGLWLLSLDATASFATGQGVSLPWDAPRGTP